MARAFRWLRTIALVVLVLILLPYLIAPLYRFVDPVSTVMLWRRATGQRVERTVVPLDRIAPALPRAVISAEDGSFCTHHGIDWRGLREAFFEADDISEMRGGSTITQQVAKNLFLWQGRSFVRKALEMPLAVWIDLVLPKRRVMEIYLNIAEWGPNGEFGAEAGRPPCLRQIGPPGHGPRGGRDGGGPARSEGPQRPGAVGQRAPFGGDLRSPRGAIRGPDRLPGGRPEALGAGTTTSVRRVHPL